MRRVGVRKVKHSIDLYSLSDFHFRNHTQRKLCQTIVDQRLLPMFMLKLNKVKLMVSERLISNHEKTSLVHISHLL